jgi:hypothetical protein
VPVPVTTPLAALMIAPGDQHPLIEALCRIEAAASIPAPAATVRARVRRLLRSAEAVLRPTGGAEAQLHDDVPAVGQQ